MDWLQRPFGGIGGLVTAQLHGIQARVRNYRPTWLLNNTDPISGNFYPVTTAIEIAEAGKSALSILTDRSQGESDVCFLEETIQGDISGNLGLVSAVEIAEGRQGGTVDPVRLLAS